MAKKKHSKKTPRAKTLSPARILDMAWDFAKPLMVEAAIRNKVFDFLAEGPQHLEQIAEATGASQRGIKALANGLVGVGLLNRKGERYQLAPETAAFLVSTRPAFVGGLFLHASSHLV